MRISTNAQLRFCIGNSKVLRRDWAASRVHKLSNPCLIKKQDHYPALHQSLTCEWPVEMTETIESFTSQYKSDFSAWHPVGFFFSSWPQVPPEFERNASLHHKRDALQGEINEGAIVWYCPRRTVKRILWLFIIPSALWPEPRKPFINTVKAPIQNWTSHGQ